MAISTRFTEMGSPARAKSERAYMKSEARFHGENAAQLRGECAAFCEAHPDLDRAAIRGR